MAWWQFAGALVLGGIVSTLAGIFIPRWLDKRQETKQLLTEEGFKKLFNDTILPDLTNTIEEMIEERIRTTRATDGYVRLRQTPVPPDEPPF